LRIVSGEMSLSSGASHLPSSRRVRALLAQRHVDDGRACEARIRRGDRRLLLVVDDDGIRLKRLEEPAELRLPRGDHLAFRETVERGRQRLAEDRHGAHDRDEGFVALRHAVASSRYADT
jgi:hypothetical protein